MATGVLTFPQLEPLVWGVRMGNPGGCEMTKGNVLLAGVVIGVLSVMGYALISRDSGPSGGMHADASNVQQVAAGEKIYNYACAECHGRDLRGEPNWKIPLPTGGLPAPPHDESGHTWHHPDSLLFSYTKFGGAAAVPAGTQSNMPAFEHLLSDEEIWSVLAYIKSSWPKSVQNKQARLNQQP